VASITLYHQICLGIFNTGNSNDSKTILRILYYKH